VFTVGLTISGLISDKIYNIVRNSDLAQTYLSIIRLYPVCGYFTYKQFQGHDFVFRPSHRITQYTSVRFLVCISRYVDNCSRKVALKRGISFMSDMSAVSMLTL
jgi:hypothetical protein